MAELTLYPEKPDYLIDPVRSVEYTYDAVGNRTQMIADGKTTHYTYDHANRLIQAGEDILIYDIEKTTEAGTVKYEYTGDNKLKGVYYPDRTSVEYTYDAFRRKASRSQVFYDITENMGEGQGSNIQQGGHPGNGNGNENALSRGQGKKVGLHRQMGEAEIEENHLSIY